MPALALAALWLAGRDRGRRLRVPELVAAGCLSTLFAGGVLAAHRLPTRVAEAEDPWVARGSGTLYPDPWTVDRTLYDIRYGSGKFFENLGDKLIHDTFDLEVSGTAKPQ